MEEEDFYLGANLMNKPLNGKPVWTMLSFDYLKAAIESLEKRLKKRGERLSSRATTPMMQTYKPEGNDSQELDSDGVTMFQKLIGILRWEIEIGRVDIVTELSILSSY